MTHQQGSSGYVQQFADRIFAERGVCLGRAAMPQSRPDEAMNAGELERANQSDHHVL
ncbi:hypothetical protein NLN62_31195 [Bradyrhizobium sp. CCGUVB23]|nr:hypothetical protein [Bradyrhizobium sp. CCGUVB23]